MTIAPEEYRTRQTRFASALDAIGLRGAIVVSRGGGTFDRYGNVRYLTGHYQPFVYLPENPPRWSGRSHTIFLLDASGRAVLCVSVPGEFGHEPIGVDDVRSGEDFIEVVIAAAIDLRIDRDRVGLVGLDTLPGNLWDRLRAGVPRAEFVAVDDELDAIRRVKSAAEQALIRRATTVGRAGVTAYLQTLAPGVSEADAVAAAVAEVARGGGGVYLAAASSGPMSWSYTTQAMPGFSTRTLQAGELARFDLVCVVGGYLCDFGRTAVVGEASAERAHALDVLHAGLDAAIGAVRQGAVVRDIVATADEALAAAGVALEPDDPGDLHAGYPPHWGHGLGMGWERPWFIEGEDLLIEDGMYLAIEHAVTLRDGGTVAAEQNLLVHANGVEVLTVGPDGTWS